MVLLVPAAGHENERELTDHLRSVIITRSKDGATTDEIIDDYRELTGSHLLDIFYDRAALMGYLCTLDGVWYSTDGIYGLILWFCSTPKTKHVVRMIQQQRSPHGYRQYMPRAIPALNFPSTGTDFPAAVPTVTVEQLPSASSRPRRSYQQRRPPRLQRKHPYAREPARRASGFSRPELRQTRSDELNFAMYGPSYHRHQLLGDDFFLAIAKWELGFSFDPGHEIDMSGLCISGLTLSEAANRVEVAPHIADQVVVNVGTVDLLHGRPMIDLIHDLDQLLARFRERNVEPIMTTLAPIANCGGGRTLTAQRLLKFNEYICRTCPRHIDLWKQFVHADGTTRFECYQPGPRKVSGSIMAHVLWNKLGRQHLLSVLGNEIATLLTTDEQWRYY